VSAGSQRRKEKKEKEENRGEGEKKKNGKLRSTIEEKSRMRGRRNERAN
jgi:hypothetical protein